MDKTEIRKKTALVIERDGKYLLGVGGVIIRWSESPWDAWSTRKAKTARMVAERICGRIMLWNPIVGQIRE